MFIIQPANNHFTKHFVYDLAMIEQPSGAVPGGIFDHYHINKKDISGYLFQASMINQEILDFIQNFRSNTKIYLYFDKFNQQLYNDASEMVRCIVKESSLNKNNTLKNKNTIKFTLLYSERLLQLAGIGEEQKDNGEIIVDLSDLEELPKSLENILYPNTKLKIKLFNNDKINHIQNLGFVPDLDMIKVIDSCSTYIDTNLNYLLYAVLLDKRTIATEPNSIIKKTKELTIETLNAPNESKLDMSDIIKKSYRNLISKYIL